LVIFFFWRFCTWSYVGFMVLHNCHVISLTFYSYTAAEQQDTSCSVNDTSSSHTRSLGNVELEPLFHSLALQQYILLCSQVEIEKLFLFIDDPVIEFLRSHFLLRWLFMSISYLSDYCFW
jgi:hypothetical protein